MLLFALDALELTPLAVAAAFILTVGHLVITDWPLMRRDQKYMRFAFANCRKHIGLIVGLGTTAWLLMAVTLVMIGIRDAT